MSKFSEFWKLSGRDSRFPTLEEAITAEVRNVGEVPIDLFGEGYRAVALAEHGAVKEMKLGLASASRNPPEETGIVDPKKALKKRLSADKAPKSKSKGKPKLRYLPTNSDGDQVEATTDGVCTTSKYL